MTPSINSQEPLDDSESVGSFEKVHHVETDHENDEEPALSPLVNLTKSSTASTTAAPPQSTSRCSKVGWYLLGAAALFVVIGTIGNAAESYHENRGELDSLRGEIVAHKELVASHFDEYDDIIGNYTKTSNKVCKSFKKIYRKVGKFERELAECKAASVGESPSPPLERQLRKVTDELEQVTLTVETLRNEVAAYKSRNLGSDSLQAELDPIPQLLMRGIWDNQEQNAIQAFTMLLGHARDESLDMKKQFLGFGHANVVLVMARWGGSASIQRLGCQILGTLPAALLKHAASVGALDAVLFAMKQFPQDEHLHEQALFTLHHLVAKNSGNMMRLVERLAALPTVLDSMRSFPESAVAQFYGIRLLKVLGLKHQFVGAIIEAGGLVILGDVYAKWLHSSDELEKGVVELARTTLASLVSKVA